MIIISLVNIAIQVSEADAGRGGDLLKQTNFHR